MYSAALEPGLAEIGEGITHSILENSSPSPPEISFLNRFKNHPMIIKARSDRMAYTLRMLGCGEGATLLDIGAGAGLNAILSIYNGAGIVHAVEYEKQRFESARLLVKYLNLEDRVILHGESVLDVELQPDFFDGAYSFELLEHISDLSRLHRCAHSWLKCGARLYGRTGANGLSIFRILFFLREYRTIEVRPSSQYYQRRLAFIKQHAPELPECKVEKFARRTQGLLFSQVTEALATFGDTGRMPSHNPLRAPRDPETEEYMERLLNPYWLRRIIDPHGFKTRILPPYFGALTIRSPGKKNIAAAAGKLLRLTHPLSLLAAPWIEVLSEKTCDDD